MLYSALESYKYPTHCHSVKENLNGGFRAQEELGSLDSETQDIVTKILTYDFQNNDFVSGYKCCTMQMCNINVILSNTVVKQGLS